ARRQDPAPGGAAGEALSVPKKVEPAEAELRRRDLASDPLEQFRSWFAEAGAGLDVPEAMALATATPGGAPSVRMVLLKGFDERGLVFFSHHTSRKGRELEANPQAALLFHWSPLGRQVRVEGRVERVGDEEADAYFATRPRDAQLGALACRHSEPLGRGGRRPSVDRRAEPRALDLVVGARSLRAGQIVRPSLHDRGESGEHRRPDRLAGVPPRVERDLVLHLARPGPAALAHRG